MNIYEATKKALKINGGIIRPNSEGFYCECWFVPTNTSDCVIMMDENNQRLSGCWNPKLDDLISQDWQAVTKYPV
ncbi:Thoeris anti-defense Tad2 family protein [Weissella minor]|uniref:Thoeris anti-defense Tad2 family protein n=1 Tax=Weissella minor TaxID=1620 RepID=UPI003AF24BF4